MSIGITIGIGPSGAFVHFIGISVGIGIGIGVGLWKCTISSLTLWRSSILERSKQPSGQTCQLLKLWWYSPPQKGHISWTIWSKCLGALTVNLPPPIKNFQFRSLYYLTPRYCSKDILNPNLSASFYTYCYLRIYFVCTVRIHTIVKSVLGNSDLESRVDTGTGW